MACSTRSGVPDARMRLQQLPARALGRSAPAGDDRDGDRRRPGAGGRRRADDRARRDDPGADPAADPAIARRARLRVPGGNPRPRASPRRSPTGSPSATPAASLETGPMATVLRAPGHPYTAALMRSRITLSSERLRTLATLPGEPPDMRRPPPGCPFAPRCEFRLDACEQAPPAAARGWGPTTSSRPASALMSSRETLLERAREGISIATSANSTARARPHRRRFEAWRQLDSRPHRGVWRRASSCAAPAARPGSTPCAGSISRSAPRSASRWSAKAAAASRPCCGSSPG